MAGRDKIRSTPSIVILSLRAQRVVTIIERILHAAIATSGSMPEAGGRTSSESKTLPLGGASFLLIANFRGEAGGSKGGFKREICPCERAPLLLAALSVFSARSLSCRASFPDAA
jgi:hypothetical protein